MTGNLNVREISGLVFEKLIFFSGGNCIYPEASVSRHFLSFDVFVGLVLGNMSMSVCFPKNA